MALPDNEEAPAPRLSPLFRAEVIVGKPIEYGVDHGLRRRLIPILGGTVTGREIAGQIEPGGGDWQCVREEDGFTQVHARYSIMTSDNHAIGVINKGIRRGPPEVISRLMAGEVVDPALYYFMTVPRFEVGDGKYEFLRESIFVCRGVRLPEAVLLSVHRVE